jgi:hypothetical protein
MQKFLISVTKDQPPDAIVALSREGHVCGRTARQGQAVQRFGEYLTNEIA